jgi:hypothetical protein
VPPVILYALTHDAMGRELKRLLCNQLEPESRYDPQGRLIEPKRGRREYFLINPSAYEGFLEATGQVLFYIALPTIRWKKFNPSVPFNRNHEGH